MIYIENLGRRPTLTPRLSTSSLTTLPPSIEEEDNERYHPLEFIFMIVLECCRESHNIKQKNKIKNEPNNNNTNKSSLRNKFDSINSQQLGYIMHTSLAQLLNGSFGHSPQRNTKQLMMIYLSKQFIHKCIAMLEYDPIHRNNNNNNIFKLSYRHRNFLRHAQVEKLDIKLMDGMELYNEIEYVYKLNYARDCILLGKLDLEQQCFHIINHHISRYNTLICETIAQDNHFLIQLFNKIKQSCSKHYGIIPLNKFNKNNETDHEKTPTLTPTNGSQEDTIYNAVFQEPYPLMKTIIKQNQSQNQFVMDIMMV